MIKKLNILTEHEFFVPHAAQRKLFSKCNFFSQEFTKSYRRIFFYQKVRDLHFLRNLI